jgi:uncharacterized membrane protein YkvA (DUF1232 family)
MNKRLKNIILATSFKSASELLKNPSALKVKMDKASEKLNKKNIKKVLGTHWDDLKLLVRLVRETSKRQYKEVSTKTIIYAIVAIIYFLTPADLIPDIVIATGYLDDIVVLKWVITAISKDLEKFREWEKNNQSTSDELN